MYIALVSSVLIASGAAFWVVATYAQRHWPTQLQFVAAWVASSVVAAWAWNYAWLGHTLITAGPTYYCGWQDTAPCTYSAFFKEQLEWFEFTFMLMLIPAALSAALVFVTAAYLGKGSTRIRDNEDECEKPSKQDIILTCVLVIITTTSVVLTQTIEGIAELLVISGGVATASWLIGKFVLRRPMSKFERDKLWLWSSLSLGVLASFVGIFPALTQDLKNVYGIIALLFWMPLSAALYVVPVAALSRLIILSSQALGMWGWRFETK